MPTSYQELERRYEDRGRELIEKDQLITDLVKCVEMLMPGIGYVVADIGFLNDTLVKSREVTG